MQQSPSKPESKVEPSSYRKIMGVLGICLAASSCNKSEASTEDYSRNCRVIIDDARTEIYCFLPSEHKEEGLKPPEKLKQSEIDYAKSRQIEMDAPHIVDMRRFGGQFFEMSRLPEMEKENPKSRGKVYMQFPEKKEGTARALVYFHGNGGQGYGYPNEISVMQFAKDMQDAGDEVILISPEDGWGNFKPEETYKKKPGNWRDFNDPDTLANLISFAERMHGERVDHITLASFSGGNLGTKKSLRALEKVKETNPEMASVYSRINQIAYFDSATGSERQYIARWATAHPNGQIWNAFNKGGIYRKGNELLLETMEAQGISSDRVNWEYMKFNEGHGIYEEYFKRFTAAEGN